MLCACHKGIIGDPDYRHEKPTIDSVSYTPNFINTGDTVLIDYKIGTEVFYDDGIYTADVPPAGLRSTAGELVPLESNYYHAGDPLPDFDQAQADNDAGPHQYQLMTDSHVYILFRAPDTPQLVEITYILGTGSWPRSGKGHHELVLEVH